MTSDHAVGFETSDSRVPAANRFPLATAPATCAGDHKYATLTA